MKESVIRKLEGLLERNEEVLALLSDATVISDQDRFRGLSKEYSQLEDVVSSFKAFQQAQKDFDYAKEMLEEDDLEMREMAQDEYKQSKQVLEKLEDELQVLLLPTDPNDDTNAFLEIRAGAGGDEAAIFAGDLYRMYSRYCEANRWQMEVMNVNEGEHGGFKEIIVKISGDGAYGKLKFESGGHRVQRVPETESQGRVHTSACTVVVLHEVPEAEAISINAADLKVDTFRASGAGGQHVNKTDSAIRITHIPSGIIVECQDQRSQHKNRAQAMSVLQARIMAAKQEKIDSEQAETRKLQVGSGDRSERIRTYNYPQGRMTDHRINLTLYKLAEVMAGDLEQVIEPLINEYQADQLASLSSDE